MRGRPDIQKSLDTLLETIAWEELGLAALVQAEADKQREVAALGIAGPVGADDVLRHNRAVARVLRLIGTKERLLGEKLRLLLALKGERDR